ncbi:MAG: hypothetical protein WDO19_22255 [Bacteroidota bacterium]
MKKLIILVSFISQFFFVKAQSPDFSKYPFYKGNDLGLIYSPAGSTFRIWSPVAEKAELLIYGQAVDGSPEQTIGMNKSEGGTWTVTVHGDQKRKFYVFRVMINNSWLDEVPDPYAKIVGINGKRAMIGDLGDTDPAGWQKDKMVLLKDATDAVIYELHIRDAGIASNSGIINKGKFKGLTEKGTKNESGLSTGLDHLKELGVTHVHLLPFLIIIL